MKKVAKEFLFFLAILIICIPLGFLFLYFLRLVSETESGYTTRDEDVFVLELYIVGYIVSFVGIYMVRIIIAAIKLAIVSIQPSEKP